jgi:hypothetical protein
LACKLSVLQKHSILFASIFGVGAKFGGGGEDTIFFQKLINTGIRVYTCQDKIAVMRETESTWFKGYDKKFFTDKGAMLAHIYPHLAKLIARYHVFRHQKKYKVNGISRRQAVKWIKEGIKEYKSL